MKGKIKCTVSKGDNQVGYISLPIERDADRRVNKTISLQELIEGYNGIPVYLNLNEKNELVGIEIVG